MESELHAKILAMAPKVRAMAGNMNGMRRTRYAVGHHPSVNRGPNVAPSQFTQRNIPNNDAFQDAMVKMLSVAADYTGAGGATMQTYLHTVAKHEVLKSSIKASRPCWAPKSPQHVEVMPKHHVVEFSTQSQPMCPAADLDRGLVKAAVDRIIDACEWPAAARMVLLEEVTVRFAAKQHGVAHLKLQAVVGKVTEAIRADAALREMSGTYSNSDPTPECGEESLRVGVVQSGPVRVVPFYRASAAAACAKALAARTGQEHTVLGLAAACGLVVRSTATKRYTDAAGSHPADLSALVL